MRKLFLYLALILYVLFLIETITGYWIWKPREVSKIFFSLMERGTAYWLHVNVLPVLLVLLFSVHSYWGIYKRMKNEKIKYCFLLFNFLVLSLIIYLHFV
jgi:thiosulfate reductase cytochrome b subunit